MLSPLQMIALAQLNLGSLHENPERLKAEVEVLRKTLNDCARQIRDVSIGLAPSQLEAMSLVDVIGASVCLRDRVCVTADVKDFPQGVPYTLKSCLYQLLEQAIRCILPHTSKARLHVRARTSADKLLLELAYSGEFSKPSLWLAAELEGSIKGLRHWIEALGGELSAHCEGEQLTNYCESHAGRLTCTAAKLRFSFRACALVPRLPSAEPPVASGSLVRPEIGLTCALL